MNWQPIATAPKDGTRILGYEPKGAWKSARGYKHDIGVMYWHQPGNPEKEGFWCATVIYMCRPTHWMPLPEPPK